MVIKVFSFFYVFFLCVSFTNAHGLFLQYDGVNGGYVASVAECVVLSEDIEEVCDEVRVVDSSDDLYSVQNAQGQKTEFTNGQQNDFQFTNPNVALASLVPGRTVRTGQVIPIILRTGINSDLPGVALARVSSNVYSYDGRNVLIPAGSDVYGVYDSKVSFNQKRLVIGWNRIVRPDGVSLVICGQPSIDLDEQMEFGELLSYSALLTGYVVALEGTEELFDLIPHLGAGSNAMALQSYGRVFELLADRHFNRVPPITIRSGWRGNILIQRDVIFSVRREGVDND